MAVLRNMMCSCNAVDYCSSLGPNLGWVGIFFAKKVIHKSILDRSISLLSYMVFEWCRVWISFLVGNTEVEVFSKSFFT